MTSEHEAEILAVGDLDIEGRLSGASNGTFRAVAHLDGESITCVYKPRRGERPLWDFPDGSLGHREVAAYLLSTDVGWSLIPTTIWREIGPYGEGMCQAWVEARDDDPPVDVVAVGDKRPQWHEVAEGDGFDGRPVVLVHEDSLELRRLSLLDAVINNADRKGGHVLRRVDGGIAGIDHGLTFHSEPKLRTVLWGWAGEAISPADAEDLRRALAGWTDADRLDSLGEHLGRRELACMRERAASLLSQGRYPEPDGMWPALPWPAM